MKNLLHTLLLAAVLAGCGTAPKRSPTLEVQVLAINDFHGNLMPPNPFRQKNDEGGVTPIAVGGAEALASAVKQLRAGQPHHVFVAAGDLIGATPLLSALFDDVPTLESLSLMGLHLSAVGNHEFDKGAAELLRRQALPGMRFQYLAASTVDEKTGKTLLPATAVRSFDGVQVGFIGLTLANTPNLVMPTGVLGLRFDDEAEAINREAARLQAQGVQAIVVLIHEGGYPTGGANECPALSGPINDIVKMSSTAVDVFVTGHTHHAYTCRIDGRLVTSGDKYGSMLTDIRLTLDRASGDVREARANNVLVRLDQFAKDPDQTALLAGYVARAKPLTERVLGQQLEPILDFLDPAGASPMGQLIADSHLAATRGDAGAEIAFMNTCGVRGDGWTLPPDGAIRYEHLFTVQPFGNQLVTLTKSGAELLALLERQFRSKHNCNRLQVSQGFQYAWKASAPEGRRVQWARLNGEPLQPGREYRVTVNSFMAAGGDGFIEFTQARAPRTGPMDVDAFEAHIKTRPAWRAPALDRIQLEN